MTGSKNEIIQFDNNEFGDVRTILVSGEPWFCGQDVLSALRYSESFRASKAFQAVPDQWKGVYPLHTVGVDGIGRTMDMLCLSEQGLYFFLGRSDKPKAVPFQVWVAGEVVPSIRKTGAYSLENLSIREKVHILAMGQDELDERVTKMEDEFTVFRDGLPVLPEDADRISNAVKRKGVQLMGGKDSPAYQDKSLRMRVYQDIYTNLKNSFDVSSYKNIKRLELDRALSIIERYQLPVFLEDCVANANAQQRLTLEVGGEGGAA